MNTEDMLNELESILNYDEPDNQRHNIAREAINSYLHDYIVSRLGVEGYLEKLAERVAEEVVNQRS